MDIAHSPVRDRQHDVLAAANCRVGIMARLDGRNGDGWFDVVEQASSEGMVSRISKGETRAPHGIRCRGGWSCHLDVVHCAVLKFVTICFYS